MLLADLSSFLGNIWFGLLLGVVGYIGGNVFPLSSISALFKRNN